jgi:hypothetical protein
MPHSLTENETIFLQALREILPYLKQQDDARLTKRIGIEKLADCADDLAGYIAVGISGSLSKNEQIALSCQLLRCLSRFIVTDMQLTLTLGTMIQTMGTLPHAVNQSFPGYMESKLLRYTISPMSKVT